MAKAKWSLSQLLGGLHDDIQTRLEIVRRTMAHPVSKGDGSEQIWLKMLEEYLPKRYQVVKAHVVDSKGEFSDQIDIVVVDRQYSPFIFRYQEETIVPAESVYAAFEAKQSINATQLEYAQEKIASVRRLHRTSLPIPHAGGTYPPKAQIPILGGLLTFESDWTPPMGESLTNGLEGGLGESRLDIGCVASHGYFARSRTGEMDVVVGGKPATAFLFRLIAELQFSGTVPMIDIQAYAQWLAK